MALLYSNSCFLMQIVSEKLNYSPGMSPIEHVWDALDPRI